MDIAALSTASSQMNLVNQANILVLKQAMDAAASQNQDLLNLLPEPSARLSPSHLGNKIDISA